MSVLLMSFYLLLIGVENMIQNAMNPLSFSGQVACSLGELVKETLLQLGVNEKLLIEFDHDLSVALSFEGVPDVLISVSDDRLWVWSNFSGVSENIILSNAYGILMVLMEPLDNVECGQLTFGRGNNGYELKALVNLRCLSCGDGGGLGVLLESFYERLRGLCGVIC